MTDSQFWQVIGAIDDPDSMTEEREPEIAHDIADRLRPHGLDELTSFEEHLAEKLYSLDTRAHCDAGGAASNSDDGFLYARCFVVACGRDVYREVVADPGRMPKRINQWLESLLYVAAGVFADLTGQEMEAWQPDTAFSYETGSNRHGWPEP